MITREKAYALRALIEKSSAALADADALAAVELFPAWHGSGMDCTAGKRLRHKGKLYKVIQTHQSQPDWPPDRTPALFVEVAKPGEIPVWKQPTGAQDAYMTEDKVKYPDQNGEVWESTVDNNVWQPGVYGWEKIQKKETAS